jgi:glycosyltransferase involved in cell wall biosynthesis
MKIIQLVPGSGNAFYCENCFRDTNLVMAMRGKGHEVAVVPLYLPIMSDNEHCKPDAPIFFGGINVYLQQKSSIFRKTPRWIDKLFDFPALLKWVGKKSGMTRAEELGDMTLSMLLGEEGNQAKEVKRLVDWLEFEGKPDLVQFSNALLIGMAHEIKKRLKIPLICVLQDEDIWLDAMSASQSKLLYETISKRSKDIDAFITVSQYYKDLMCNKLDIPYERVHVVYNGIRAENYLQSDLPSNPFVIGFLERQCQEKGLGVLADSFIILKKNNRIPNVKLRLAGGMSPGDEPYVDSIKKKLKSANVIDDVEFLPNLSGKSRTDFLKSLSVLSVPAEHKEAFGVYITEAMASGVPVVQPNHGAFPELLNMTKGGIIYEPNEPQSLANAIESLLLNPVQMRELGNQGMNAVREKFTIELMAKQFLSIIENVANNYN